MTKEILILLANVGMVLKKDLMRVLPKQNNNRNESKLFDKLIAKGYIGFIFLPEKSGKRRITEAIYITKAGREYLCEKLNTTYYMDIATDVNRNIKQNNPKTLLTELEKRRIPLLFNAAGMLTFKESKPSLSELKDIMNKQEQNERAKNKGNYDKIFDKKNYKILCNGLFYSIKEVREYINETSGNTYTTDKIKRTRCRGIFITNNTISLVYSEALFKNQMPQISIETEKNLVIFIQDYFGFTDDFLYYVLNNITACVITNADASIALIDKYKGFATKGMAITPFNSGLTLFKNIYAIPFTTDGVNELNYLKSYSLEGWMKESLTRFKTIKGISACIIEKPEENESSKKKETTSLSLHSDNLEIIKGLFLGKEKVGNGKFDYNPTIFLPVYDFALINAILFINKKHGVEEPKKATIVTNKSMAQTILKITKSTNNIYTLDGERIENLHYYENIKRDKKRRNKNKKTITFTISDEMKNDLETISNINDRSISSLMKELASILINKQRSKIDDYNKAINNKQIELKTTKKDVQKIEKVLKKNNEKIVSNNSMDNLISTHSKPKKDDEEIKPVVSEQISLF